MYAVDIGNTHTRLAAFLDGRIHARVTLPTAGLSARAVEAALAELGGAGRSVHVASVVPAATPAVQAAARHAGLSCRVLRPDADEILPHRLSTPATTGVDRLLAALAAGGHAAVDSGGYLVVQCGSAATVDVVNGEGVFLGGFILPGPGMWLAGLSAAAQLPELSEERPDWEAVSPGDNTRDAMLHGLHAALPAAVAGAVEAAAAGAGLPAEAPAVVTGGWGMAVLPHLARPHRYDRDLLLSGIRMVADGIA